MNKKIRAQYIRWLSIGIVSVFSLALFVVSFLSTRTLSASDGSGTNTVSPTAITAGSTSTTPLFTFTAGETMDSGGFSITVPVSSGWTVPQGTAGVAGYTTASSSAGMVGTVLNALESTTNWSAPLRMTLVADTADMQEGTASLSNTITSAAVANAQWYFNYGSASNWGAANSTNGARVGFWIKSSIASSAGAYSWQDDDTASLASPLDTRPIAALSANTWTYSSVTLGAARTSIASYGFRYTTDTGAVIVKTDSISSIFDAADVITNWSGSGNVIRSVLNTSGNYKEGIAAIRCTYAAAASVGSKCLRTTGAASNFVIGPGTKVSFWVRSSIALNAGDFQWMDDDSATLASPVDAVSLPAIPANTWTYVTLTAPNSANMTVRSYGFNQAVDKGAFTLDIDALGKQINSNDSITDWSPIGTSQTLSVDAVTVHEGIASLKNVITTAAVAGDSWYETFGTAQNWSNYTMVGFWIRSSVNITAGDLKFEYATTSDLSAPIASVNIGALTANTWSYQKLSLSGTRSSIKSYGVKYATDIGAVTVNLDDALIGPGVPTFSGGDTIFVRLLSLASGQTANVAYGSGGSTSGITAPTTTGVYTFTTKSLVSDGGSYTTISSPSPTITISAAPVSEFMLTDPGDIAAGSRVGYTLTRRDQYGNSITSGEQIVYLYSNSTGANKSFYTSAVNGSPVTSITFADGASTAQFWYYDELAGSWIVSASDNASAPDGATNIDDATDGLLVSVGATSLLTLNNPGDVTAGERVGYIVTRKDQFGNSVTTGSDTVYLYTNSTGNNSFYATSTGGIAISSITIGSGTSTAQFWYYDELAGSWTVVASDNASTPDGTTNIDDATDSVTVSVATISQFSLNDPGNTQAGARLGYVVTRKDQFGNAITSGSQTVYLYSSATGTYAFYATSSGGTVITSFVIGSGTSTAQFWYYDEQIASITITASDNASTPDGTAGIDDATDVLSILPASTSEFVLNDPGDMVAGTRAGYVVTRKDPFNHIVTSGDDTVYLYSSSTGNAAFYDAPSGGTAITSLVIGSGTSTAQFWYYDDKNDAVIITASDNASAPDGVTNIDDAVDSIAISVASASQIVISNPVDTTVGLTAAITLRVQDAFGNLVSTYANDVTLQTTGSSTGAGLVDIVNGVGTKNISDVIAETVQLTLSDTQGTGLNVTSSQDIVFSAGSTVLFELTDQAQVTAGSRAAYVITRKDQYGNAVTTGSSVIYLYSNSTSANAGFYDAALNGNSVTSVTIGSGESTVAVWYYDELVGSWTISASDHASSPDGTAGIDDATDVIVVNADVTAQLIVNNPGDMVAGTRIGYIVTRKDQFSNTVSTGTNTVYLSSDSMGNKLFYSAETNGSVITSIQIGSGSSTADFWYYDDRADTVTVTISDNASAPDGAVGINDATDVVTVSPAAISQFVLYDPGDMTVFTRAGYAVTRKDAFGNSVTTGVTTGYFFTNSHGTSTTFYDAVSGGNTVTSFTIPNGLASVNFWYYESETGSWTITVSDQASTPNGATGIDDATDSITVTAIPIVATRFVIIAPTDTAAGTQATITVRAEDEYGSVDTTYQTDVTLLTSGSATGGGLVDIVNGVGTIGVTDVMAETINLTLSDTQSTGLNISSTQNIVFATGSTAQFTVNDPGDAVAGSRVHYVLTRKDQYGNAVIEGSNTVYLYSSGTAGTHRFHDAASDGSVITSIVIGSGQSSIDIWYSDDTAATVTITASDHATAPNGTTGIDDATDSVLVNPGATSAFTLSDPGNMTIGTRIEYTVTRTDAFGNSVISGNDTVYLFAQPAGTSTAFYDVASGGSPVTNRVISNGQSQVAVWFYTNTSGAVDVVATDNSVAPDGLVGITDGSDGVQVSSNAILATRFVIIDPVNATVGDTVIVTIRAQDDDGNIDTSYQQDVQLNASGSATGEGLVNIVNGVGTKTISDTVAETVRLTLTDTQSTGLDSASIQFIIFSSVPVAIPTASQSGGGAAVIVPILPAQLTFSGEAFPEGTMNISVREKGLDVALKQDVTIGPDGEFNAGFTGLFGGGKVYSILAKDKDGRPTPVQTVTVDESGDQVIRNLVVPPSIGFVRSTVLKGDLLTIIGYAVPGSIIEASVDGGGATVEGVTAAQDGAYKILIPTADLEYGDHIVRTYQRMANGIMSPSSLQKTFSISRLINPKTDLNSDARVDISDWSIFMTRWNSTNEELRKQIDLNDDGKTDVADFSIFIRNIKKRL